MLPRLAVAMILAAALLTRPFFGPPQADADPPREYALTDGRFFTQTGNGVDTGFAISDAGGILFYSAFQRLGGVTALGYPISDRFEYKGFTTQVLQKAVLQWQPRDGGRVFFVNVFDELSAAGRDPWLVSARSTPAPAWLANEESLSFEERLRGRLAWLDANPAIRAQYNAVPDPLSIYGLPASPVADMGNAYVIRLQRAVIQQWKVDVPWAKAGEVTVANGGDVAKEAGLFPAEPLIPRDLRTGRPVATPPPTAAPARAAPPAVDPNRVPLEILPARNAPLVALDPGHGGTDPGTSARYADGTVLHEKDLTLRVALKTAQLLQRAGYRVMLTRQADVDVNSRGLDLNGDGRVNYRDDLQARIDLVNASGAALLVSMHFNGFSDPAARGTTVYYNMERMFAGDNRRLATLVMDSLYAALYRAGYRDAVYRGIQPDTTVPGEEHYFLLGAADGRRIARATNQPAVIAEALFLTNPIEAAIARQEATQDALAIGYAAAISRYFAP